jgi:very-short-patch-repair endonuclease
MRKKPTHAEDLLWAELRRKKLGVKFRRQSNVLWYIPDFYCAELKLVIEVDGGIHKRADVLLADRAKEAHLKSAGYRVIRISNDDVENNMDAVLSTIKQAIEEGAMIEDE